MNLQLLLSRILTFLGETEGPSVNVPTNYKDSWYYKTIQPVVNIIDQLLLPIIIVLGTAGSIYGIMLGVQYARAESSDKRDEAKKRMIHAIIGIVVTLVILILMKLLTNYAEDIAKWITESAE